MKKIYKILLCLLAVLMLLLLAACSGPLKLEEGERYFEGEIPFEYAESCTLSYVLSADGQSIRRVNVTFTNYKYQGKYTSGSISKAINESYGSKSVSLQGGTLDAQGYLEIPTREITLRFNFMADGVSGEMDYSYPSKMGETPKFEIFLGTYPFTMEDKTDSLLPQAE